MRADDDAFSGDKEIKKELKMSNVWLCDCTDWLEIGEKTF